MVILIKRLVLLFFHQTSSKLITQTHLKIKKENMIINSKALGFSLLLLAAVTANSVSHAMPSEGTSTATSEVSHRSEKKIGAYLGLLGDPHPSILGFNAAYNVLDYMRASVGFGRVSVSTMTLNNQGALATQDTSMTTIGVGSRFFLPGLSLTPTAGLGYSHVFFSSTGNFASDYKANNIYVNAGFDWQAANGFNMGGGLNVSMNNAAPTAPYLNLGYFL